MNPLINIFGEDKRWVVWRYETKDGRLTKIPYTFYGIRASSTDPSTWDTYDTVRAVSDKVGIVFKPDQLLLGIDIDHCLVDGIIVHEQKETIEKFIGDANTYVEISPSGTGLHLFLITAEPLVLISHKKAPYEIYSSGRYFTLTGKSYGKEKDVRKVTCDEAYKLLNIIGYPWAKTAGQSKKAQTQIGLSDSVVLEKMFASKNGSAIRSLYDGNKSKYHEDDSSADMALCSHLAFWTNRNAAQMDRIWTESPLGSRVKTQDRKDYRDRTIKKAIESCKETYTGENGPKDYQTVERGSLITIKASDVTPKKIQWLWPGKIAKGKLTLLVGNPGLGKSQTSIHIAAVTSTGDKWPLQSEDREPAKVLILSGEDDFEDTIVPRLIALDACLENISLIEFSQDIDSNGRMTRRSFNLKKDVDKLEVEFSRLNNVALLIVDPITAYMGDTDSHKNADVRAVLTQLSTIASKFKVAVLAVTHFNKSGTADAQMRVMGSLAFVAAARSAFLVMKDEKDENVRLFLPMKNNLAKDTGGLSYTIQPRLISVNGEDIETSMIIWGDKEILITANEAMKGIAKKINPQLKEAEEFLKDLLTANREGIDGKKIKKLANESGISNANLYRAAKNIGVEQSANGFGKPRLWQLLENVFTPKSTPPPVDPQAHT